MKTAHGDKRLEIYVEETRTLYSGSLLHEDSTRDEL
jgi:hypothetical protein